MQAQTPKENASSKRGISIQLPITKILYLFSLMIGIIGTYFSLRSHTKDDTDMPTRVLYSMTLMLAGMLLEAAQVSESSKQPSTRSSVPKQVEPAHQPLEVSDEQSPEATVMENKATLNRSYSSGYGLDVSEKKGSDKTSAPPLVADDSVEMAELTPLADKNTDTRSFPTTQSTPLSPPFTGMQCSFRTGFHLFSASWFSQAFALFVRNAIQESTRSLLLPYTTLIGLATGHLFHVSLKPWRLGGIRDWIQMSRNKLSALEAMIFFFLPPIFNQNLSFYYYTTAAFWSGYNLNELTFTVTEKLLGRRMQNVTPDDALALGEGKLRAIPTHRISDLLTSISGGVLVSASILLIRLMPEDQAEFRNIFAQLLGATGCYALTYPLGLYLGHKIPSRYYEDTLAVSTYLLIPLAAPNLSVLHYVAMTGAGICGGVSNHIIHSRYKNRLTVMQYQLDKIQQIMAKNPGLSRQLLELPLPADGLLLENRKKHLTLRWIARFFYGMMVVSSIATQSLWKDYPIILSNIIGAILSSTMINWILPKYSPSIYDSHDISRLSRFSYFTSFTQTYLIKIMMFIGFKTLYDSNGNFLLLQKPRTAEILFAANLINISFWLFFMKNSYKSAEGGYIPYLPSSQEILKLQIFARQDSWDHGLKTMNKDQPLTLNYHLLQFMKKNIQLAIEPAVNDTITPSNDPNVCFHPLQHISLFAIPRNPSLTTPVADRFSSFPLATLHCQECKEDVRSLHTDFNHDDQRYIEERFDVSLESRTGDAAIRGNALAFQFQFGLPAGLGLTENVNRFSI